MSSSLPRVLIRLATELEAPAVRAIIRAGWASACELIYPPSTLAGALAGKLAQQSSWVSERRGKIGTLVAEQSANLVGMAGLARCANGEGELTHLYVLQQARGSGIGLALWKASLELSRQHGCPALRVWALAGTPATEFYTHRGALPVEEGIYTVGDQAEKVLCHRLEW